MTTKWIVLAQILVAVALLLSACGGAAEETPGPAETPASEVTEAVVETEAPMEETEAVTEAPTEAITEEATAAETEAATETVTEEATAAATQGAGGAAGALESIPVDEAPELDGASDDTAWQDAPVITVPVAGGANNGSTEVQIRSVYTDDQVFFLVTWADPTQSFIRSPWEKQADGTWKKLTDPNDKGGDNNLYYEDKLAFIWPIDNSIPNFETQGCFTACHAGENSDVKPFGNKYTSEEGQKGDIWHWKSVRNLNQVDDQFLDHVRYSADTPEAGRHSDPNDGGGYVNNETEDKQMPAFMPPDGGAKDGSPGHLLDEEKVPFDDSLFQAGDQVPSVTIAQFEGDRGNLSAGWKYENGMWTLEFGRDLETGSEFDVQFDDLETTYFFGVATFDNAQVRHAFQNGATAFTFRNE